MKQKNENVMYVYFIEEKPPGWAYPEEAEPSREAVKVLKGAVQAFEHHGITAVPLWSMGDNPGQLIVKAASELDPSTVVIGATKRTALERVLKGEVLRTIEAHLPKEKQLIICS